MNFFQFWRYFDFFKSEKDSKFQKIPREAFSKKFKYKNIDGGWRFLDISGRNFYLDFLFVFSAFILSLIFGFFGGWNLIIVFINLFLGILLLFLFFKIYFFHKNRFEMELRNKIKQVLISKNLYWDNDLGCIVAFPAIFYSFQGHFLNLKIDTFGSFSDSADKLGNSFQEVIGKPLIDVFRDNSGRVVYRFEYQKNERLIFKNLNDFSGAVFNNPNNIFLIGRGLFWNFENDPHGLIVGTTGSGKSYFLNFLLAQSFIKKKNGQDGKIFVADPKHSDLFKIGQNIADFSEFEPAKIAGLLRQAVEIMKDRYSKMEKNNSKSFGKSALELGFAPIFIFVDEISALMSLVDKNSKKDIENYLKQLTMLGRQAGICIILITQRADVESGILGSIKNNLNFRLYLGNTNNLNYSIVFGKLENDLLNLNEKYSGYYSFNSEGNKPYQLLTPSYNFSDLLEFLKINSQ